MNRFPHNKRARFAACIGFSAVVAGLLTAPAPARAATHAAAFAGPVRVELIDLRPNDDVPTAITFSSTGNRDAGVGIAATDWPAESLLHQRLGGWSGVSLNAQTTHTTTSAALFGGSALSPAGTQARLEGRAWNFTGPPLAQAAFAVVFALDQSGDPTFELAPWTGLVLGFDVEVDLMTQLDGDMATAEFSSWIQSDDGHLVRDDIRLACAAACRKSQTHRFELSFQNTSDKALTARWSIYGNVMGGTVASPVPAPAALPTMLTGLGLLGSFFLRRAAAKGGRRGPEQSADRQVSG